MDGNKYIVILIMVIGQVDMDLQNAGKAEGTR